MARCGEIRIMGGVCMAGLAAVGAVLAQDAVQMPALPKMSDGSVLRLAITPVMGLKRIERFPPVSAGQPPVAVIPDANTGARRIKKIVDLAGGEGVVVQHKAILADRKQAAAGVPLAFQARLVETKLQQDGKAVRYVMTMRLSLAVVQTGKALCVRLQDGFFSEAGRKKTESADIFYACLEDATVRFFASDEAKQALAGLAGGAKPAAAVPAAK